MVIGAGGAARGIVYALLSRGFERVAIVNRTHARAEALAAHFGGSTTAAPWANLATELAESGLARQREHARHDRTAAARHRAERLAASTPSSPTRSMFLCDTPFVEAAQRLCDLRRCRGRSRHAAPAEPRPPSRADSAEEAVVTAAFRALAE